MLIYLPSALTRSLPVSLCLSFSDLMIWSRSHLISTPPPSFPVEKAVVDRWFPATAGKGYIVSICLHLASLSLSVFLSHCLSLTFSQFSSFSFSVPPSPCLSCPFRCCFSTSFFESLKISSVPHAHGVSMVITNRAMCLHPCVCVTHAACTPRTDVPSCK